MAGAPRSGVEWRARRHREKRGSVAPEWGGCMRATAQAGLKVFRKRLDQPVSRCVLPTIIGGNSPAALHNPPDCSIGEPLSRNKPAVDLFHDQSAPAGLFRLYVRPRIQLLLVLRSRPRFDPVAFSAQKSRTRTKGILGISIWGRRWRSPAPGAQAEDWRNATGASHPQYMLKQRLRPQRRPATRIGGWVPD